MRKYDIPYVRRGPATFSIPKPLEKLSLEEIKNKYIKTCGKANGRISYCSNECKMQCEEGKKAIEMSEYQIPLYDGKTLLEKAREENAKRKEKKRSYIRHDGWWEESLAYGDQVEWLMTNLGIPRNKAKQKIYQYKWSHGLLNKESKEVSVGDIKKKIAQIKQEQKSRKKKLDEIRKLYYKEKEEYEKNRKELETLNNAISIISN